MQRGQGYERSPGEKRRASSARWTLPGRAEQLEAGADGAARHVREQHRALFAARAGTLLLPQRLTATREGVRLRVVMDRWKLDAR